MIATDNCHLPLSGQNCGSLWGISQRGGQLLLLHWHM